MAHGVMCNRRTTWDSYYYHDAGTLSSHAEVPQQRMTSCSMLACTDRSRLIL